jgi:ribosome-binding protein aMBF1 (putative translation factor)
MANLGGRIACCTTRRTSKMSPRQPREPDLKTYAGRVANKLRTMREDRGWSVEQTAEYLKIPASTLYAYERGKAGGGNDMPLNMIATVAEVFGFKTASGWLPD